MKNLKEAGKENYIFLNESRPILVLAASALAKELGSAICIPTSLNMLDRDINILELGSNSNLFILGIGPSDEEEDDYIYQILKKHKDKIKLWLSNHPVGIFLEYSEEYQTLVTHYQAGTCLPALMHLNITFPKSWLDANHLLEMNPLWKESNEDERTLIRCAKIFKIKSIFEKNTGEKIATKNIAGKAIEEILNGTENRELSVFANLYTGMLKMTEATKNYLLFTRTKKMSVRTISPYLIDFDCIAQSTKSISPYHVEYTFFGNTYSLFVNDGKIISHHKSKEIGIYNNKTSTG
jgi:hypothetical protein